MKEKVLITGFNSSVSKYLQNLIKSKYEIVSLTTNKTCVNSKTIFYWNPSKNILDKESLKEINHIIHLSGFSILKKWTKKNKRKIHDSRIKASILLYEKCLENNIKPKTFISASAIGIYNDESSIKKEDSNLGNDWISNIVKSWEKSADKFNNLGSRVVKMRISLILSKNHGFLKYLLLGLKFRTIVCFGNNKSIINWIHIHDLSKFILFALEKNTVFGSFNISSPNYISQRNLIKYLNDFFNGIFINLTLPKIIIKFLLGERSKIILFNSNIINIDKLLKTGFKFKYDKINKVFEKNEKSN